MMNSSNPTRNPEDRQRLQEELQSLVDNPTFQRLQLRLKELQSSSLQAAITAASEGKEGLASGSLRFMDGLGQMTKWVDSEWRRLNVEAKEPKGY